MELRSWLLAIRIINIICALMMTAFELWYAVELVLNEDDLLIVIVRILTPIVVCLLAFVIISAEFKYKKVVEHFKFLQYVPGLAMFNILYIVDQNSLASIFAFQFSTLHNEVATIVIASLFLIQAIVLMIMYCLKPAGTEGLLVED